MRNWGFISIFVLLSVLLDLYISRAIGTVTLGSSEAIRSIALNAYRGLSVLALVIILSLPFSHSHEKARLRNYCFIIVVGFFLGQILAGAIFLVDDLRRLILWGISGHPVSRSLILSWLGLGLGAGLFLTLLSGFGNKYRYRIHRIKLSYDNLPPAFKGLKIVQLSDIHSGSLSDPKAVEKGIDLILQEKPDLILFTGDLVNDRAVEMKDLKHVFGRLRAPMGIFSTLGNHDYGDYTWWETPEAKKANLQHLKQIQQEMGWRLLMNEHVVLERGGAQIALLGIENWSAKARFPKYGKMSEAYAGAEKYPFKILMSHDPSHWDVEVRPHYPDIDLALAGHTHGMQFGLEIPGFKWSPVKYVYKEWAGLYEAGRQKLYVNRGFGFLGYPGRVGILPEITVIQLA